MKLCPHMLAGLPDAALAGLDDLLERRRRGWLGDWPAALVLTAPALLILGVFSLYPMIAALGMSLRGGKRGDGPFVGLANYAETLSDGEFWRALKVTGYYVLGTVPMTLLLALLAALALHRIGRARGLFRTLFFLPYVTSVVAAAMVWRALFNPQGGVFNLLLGMLGFGPANWLLEPRGVLHLLTGGWVPPDFGPSLALCCVMLFDIWHGMGFMVVVLLAGLSAIPRELEEVARVDGAGRVRTLFSVTLPLLSPTLFFLAVVGCAKAFQAFNSFYALTQGAGGGSLDTRNMLLYVYAQFYEYGYWGHATASATLLTLAIVLLTAAQWRFIGKRVHYQ